MQTQISEQSGPVVRNQPLGVNAALHKLIGYSVARDGTGHVTHEKAGIGNRPQHTSPQINYAFADFVQTIKAPERDMPRRQGGKLINLRATRFGLESNDSGQAHQLFGKLIVKQTLWGKMLVDKVVVHSCQARRSRIAYPTDLNRRSEEHTSELQSLMRIS